MDAHRGGIIDIACSFDKQESHPTWPIMNIVSLAVRLHRSITVHVLRGRPKLFSVTFWISEYILSRFRDFRSR